MFRALDDSVQRLLRGSGLSFAWFPHDNPRGIVDDYDTNIMGNFTCDNPACSNTGWTSKKIAITIRRYPENKYNARVYHQRCLFCEWVSRPELDDSYADRVAYRLKKWSGVPVEAVYNGGNSMKPHESEYCEGCKAGRCQN